MKKILYICAGLALSCNGGSQKSVIENTALAPERPDVPSLAASISESELKEHLYTYASDEYEGRETGTKGQKKAIAFIKDAYEALEIPAARKNGEYFQQVPLEMA